MSSGSFMLRRKERRKRQFKHYNMRRKIKAAEREEKMISGTEKQEVEMTDRMVERADELDNAVYDMLLTFLQLYAESAEYRRLGYIPLSQDSLASAINASRVQTARELADLKRRGLVELGRRRVTPRDADGLAALLKSGFDTARSNQ